MSPDFWDDAIVVIFFVYGLAFYSLGLALLVESGRASELGFARSMRLLAGFGLLHGLHEWIDMFDRELALHYDVVFPSTIGWFRIALLVTSFLALLAFGEHLLARERQPSWYLTLGAAGVYALVCIAVQLVYALDEQAWQTATDVLARYIIGVPGALIACWALWRQRDIFRIRGIEGFVRDLTVAAVALGLYGVIGQMFTGQSVIFPSTIINSALFQNVMGFPVQLFRALMATVVAYSLIRVLQALEVESQQRLEAIERAKLESERASREELARLNEELQEANDETARLLREVRRREALRGKLLQRITAAQEAERRRIARELHDDTGQVLTGLALGLRGLATLVTKDPKLAVSRLADMELMATTGVSGLRGLINDLRPPQLDDMGLVAALRFMGERIKQSHEPFKVTLTIRGNVVALPSEIESTLFRIAQEGLTNVIKHAQASKADMTLDFSDGPALTIQDDGVGFDAETALSSQGMRVAWGLIGIQERANLINASFRLESTPGLGTTMTVRLNEPVPKGK